jgi:5'-nucleotidase (lipoprotein e(P4) family)
MPSANALTSVVVFSTLLMGLVVSDQAASTPPQTATVTTTTSLSAGARPAGIQQASTSVKTETKPVAPRPFASETPPHRALDANLYMQTSAEYRACCYQAYRLASMLLKDAAQKKSEKPKAVILDLDETVIDNSGFQSMQLRSNLSFDDRIWAMWEQTGFDKLALIPGAAEFIAEAKSLDVTVVYISNRNDKFRDETKKGLELLSLGITAEDQLLLSTTTSDKTDRRKQVADKYEVVLNIGDNLRDFDDSFRSPKLTADSTVTDRTAAIAQRKQTVDQQRSEFGSRWVILPNPAYGEWTKSLGQGLEDLQQLVPTAP